MGLGDIERLASHEAVGDGTGEDPSVKAVAFLWGGGCRTFVEGPGAG